MKTDQNLGDILAAIPQPNSAPDDVPTRLDAADIQRRHAEFSGQITELCEGVGRLPEGEKRRRISQSVDDVKVLVDRLARVESLAHECDLVAEGWAGFALIPLADGDARDTLEKLNIARDRRQHADDLRRLHAGPIRAGIVALIEHVRAELGTVPKVEPVAFDGDFLPKTSAQRRAGKGVAVS